MNEDHPDGRPSNDTPDSRPSDNTEAGLSDNTGAGPSNNTAAAPARLTAKQFQGGEGVGGWRVLGLGAALWVPASSHASAAAFAARAWSAAGLVRAEPETAGRGNVVLEASIRRNGTLTRLPLGPNDDGFTPAHVEVARIIAQVAEECGLQPDPAVLQDLQLTLDTDDQTAVMPFWQIALGYEQVGDDDLVHPLHRHPPIWFQDQDAARPLRNRIHLDAVHSQEHAVAIRDSLRAHASSVVDRGYYATLADPAGNEVDVLPLPEGADRWDGPETDDWRLVFSAMAAYRVGAAAEALEFAQAVAQLADAAELSMGIDLRPLPGCEVPDSEGEVPDSEGEVPDSEGGVPDPAYVVVLDSGKDRWETEDGYPELAAQIQAEARRSHLTPQTSALSFVQIGIDAGDIPSVRAFWAAVLNYELDPREHVTDLVDPRQLNAIVFLQDLDAEDTARRQQRNRFHVDLFLPQDQVQARLEAAIAAGGTVVRDGSPIWWTVADPEGNEVDITTSWGREEHWAATAAG